MTVACLLVCFVEFALFVVCLFVVAVVVVCLFVCLFVCFGLGGFWWGGRGGGGAERPITVKRKDIYLLHSSINSHSMTVACLLMCIVG